jgi:hypothetical protein
MIWEVSTRFARRALPLADRHYNRQKPGTPQFVPPGRCIVLMSKCGRALWVSSWPLAEFTRHEWAGAWMNTMFRNEGAGLSSELIGSAVAATRAIWGEPPGLGMVTFIDASKVRKKRDPGRCYLRAGFELVGATKVNALLALQLVPSRMPDAEAPNGWTPSLYAATASGGA